MSLNVATWATGLRSRVWSLLLLLVLDASLVLGQDGTISVFTAAQGDVPDWASTNALTMMLNTRPGGQLPIQFTVIPLTQSLGLNGSDTALTVCLLYLAQWASVDAPFFLLLICHVTKR